MEKQLLTIKDLEELTGFKKSWIYQNAKEGNIPKPIRIGQSFRWKREAFMEWLKGLE